MQRTMVLAALTILVGLVVLGLKYLAYVVTGSVALFSDALESIINVITAGVALYTLWVSAQPADAEHPYGHHKAEYFSAVLEGVLIGIAALVILHEAVQALLAPHAIEAPLKGLAISGVGTVLNAIWSYVLIREGRRARSPALDADGRHLLTDVVTSAGVTLGVFLVVATDVPQLDPALAAAVALYILWSGWRLVAKSFSGLLDEAAPEETIRRIKTLIAAQGDGALEAHDLRTRHAGRMTFLEFHLVVPGSMTVSTAHAICDRLEAAIRGDLQDVQTTIHIEPEEKAKHSGIVVV